MSYHRRHTPRVARPYGRAVAAPAAMGAGPTWVDNLFQTLSSQCASTISSSTAGLENARYEVVADLQKKSFYLVEDFDRMISQMWAIIDKAKDNLDRARAEDWGAAGAIAAVDQSRTSLYNRFAEGTEFVQSLNYAKLHNIEIVDAPGFWRWIEKSLIDVELAQGLLAYISCKKPAWLSILQVIYEACQVLLAIVKKAGGVAVDAAIAAGKFILTIPDKIGALWNALKWGVIIGGGGFVAFKIYEAHRKKGS